MAIVNPATGETLYASPDYALDRALGFGWIRKDDNVDDNVDDIDKEPASEKPKSSK